MLNIPAIPSFDPLELRSQRPALDLLSAAGDEPSAVSDVFIDLLQSAILTGVVAGALYLHDPKKPRWTPALFVGGVSFGFGLMGTVYRHTRHTADV